MIPRIFLVLLLLPAVSQGQAPDTVFWTNGLVDLSRYDFTQRDAARVKGGWAFYWKKLITPTSLSQAGTPAWISGNSGWAVQPGLEGLGYGTYQLFIRLPHNHQGLSIYFPTINAASRIWLNGRWVASTGLVGETSETYRPELTTLLIPLPDKEETVELLIQVANFTHPNGGLSGYPRVDRTADLVEDLTRSNGIQNFFAGCLVALCLYQLILFFLYNKGRPFLWMSLICFGVAARSMVIHGGSLLLPNLFPAVPWEAWKKLEFGSVYAIVAFFPLYVYDLFPPFAPVKPLRVFVVIGILTTGLVLITTQVTFGLVLEIVHLCYLLTFIYAFYTIGKAWKTGERDARIILFGILASFPLILLEIMKNSALIALNIPSMYYVELGVLVFLLFQVYLLANHQAKSYKSLEAMNINLEGMVNERTQELRTANDVRDKLLSVISHDVRSPLNSLQGMLDLYNKGLVSPEEFTEFSRQVQSQLGNTGLLVENILVWTSSQLKGVEMQRQEFSLNEMIDRNIELFRSTAESKRIAITSLLTTPMTLTWEKNIVHLALRNLLANAIKFSHEGGTIEIGVAKEGKDIHVRVTDHGIGIDSATMEMILSSKRSTSRAGTSQETGAGIGLSLVRDYLIHAGGSLTAESMVGKGSTFTIIIPQG